MVELDFEIRQHNPSSCCCCCDCLMVDSGCRISAFSNAWTHTFHTHNSFFFLLASRRVTSSLLLLLHDSSQTHTKFRTYSLLIFSAKSQCLLSEKKILSQVLFVLNFAFFPTRPVVSFFSHDFIVIFYLYNNKMNNNNFPSVRLQGSSFSNF